MRQEVTRIAKRLTIITVVFAALSAYGTGTQLKLESWIADSAVFIGLWIADLPLAALTVLAVATPWYLIKWLRNRRPAV